MATAKKTVKQPTPLDAAEAPVTALFRVGDALAQKLTKLNIHSVQDVLLHLPSRYEDRTQIAPIGALEAGQRVAIEGRVIANKVMFTGRRNLQIIIEDESGVISARFFYFNRSQQQRLSEGVRVRTFGEVRRKRRGVDGAAFEMIHPTCVVLGAEAVPLDDRLTPVYPTTDGINQARLKGLTTQALNQLNGDWPVQELLPHELLDLFEGLSISDALKACHRPPVGQDLTELENGKHIAQRRIAFEELLGHYLSLRRMRQHVKKEPAHAFTPPFSLVDQFLTALPFTLTGAQTRVSEDIHRDLQLPHPMMRLVQGDVGSGKTVVAAMAALPVIEQGMQAAIMAPTELLAEQHLQTFYDWFEPLGLRVVWLAGKLSAADRRKVCAEINQGDADLVVGTHALFQKGVNFRNLSVLVVDEQHRFGVDQRLSLREKGMHKGMSPHQLVMTATPIPRTLAMTMYADLDYSVIDELPPGRKAIKTVAIENTRRRDIIDRVRVACEAGDQAYWVCPLVEESEQLQCQDAENTHERLTQRLPGLKIGLVHGRMRAEQKEQVMRDFKQGKIHVLVATTVVEVGVDVPNASLMIIENAERMGLAQLHQLRGRVGRGDKQSHCVLLYKPPLSEHAKTRLTAMRDTNDGFQIAEQDLKLRGAGEVLGTKQTGSISMRIANLVRDADMMPLVQKWSEELLTHHPEIAEAIIERWVGLKVVMPMFKRSKAGAYWRLMRFHKPIGIYLLLWPTLWALWVAADGFPGWHLFLVFVAGTVLTRAGGCAINDLADIKWDGEVKRTRDRPLVTGELNTRQAHGAFVVCMSLAFLLVLSLNTLTVLLSVVGVLLAALYPFLKRWTYFPQVGLGLAFGWAVPMAFAAVQNQVPDVAWAWFAVTLCWTLMYDTQYAMVDRDDDIKIGIKSTAIAWGRYDRHVVGALQIAVVLGLLLLGVHHAFGLSYYLSVFAAFVLFAYQQRLTLKREPAQCFKAFLNNHWVGAVLFVGLFLEYLRA